MRYELSDYEWSVIRPMLPNKPRGVPRVNDRRVLNGIFWVLRSGAPWRDVPESYGPPTTCYNRFVRWWRAAVWDRDNCDLRWISASLRFAWLVIGRRQPRLLPMIANATSLRAVGGRRSGCASAL